MNAINSIAPWMLLLVVPFIVLLLGPLNFGVFLLGKNKNKKLSFQYRPKILVVDDDESSILGLLSILSSQDVDVTLASSGEEMIKDLKNEHYDLVFLDRMMPNFKGDIALGVADGTLSEETPTAVVFFTGTEQKFDLPTVSQFSILGVWEKTINYQALQKRVNLLLKMIHPEGSVHP